MKKLFCYLLIGWLVLVAGGASAHSISDIAHVAKHSAHMHAADMDAATHDKLDSSNAGADSTDICKQSHCGHGHGTAIPASSGMHLKASSQTHAPRPGCRWASAAVCDNIERPKWPVATPAVVSLLA